MIWCIVMVGRIPWVQLWEGSWFWRRVLDLLLFPIMVCLFHEFLVRYKEPCLHKVLRYSYMKIPITEKLNDASYATPTKIGDHQSQC
jgi:hypothetical protein